jgi:hypothetical protein
MSVHPGIGVVISPSSGATTIVFVPPIDSVPH